MKRLLLTLFLVTGIAWSANSMADTIGIVNIGQVVKSSPQIEKIKAQLKKKFSPEQKKIQEMGRKFQDDVKKLQKNQAVMDKNSITNLRNSIVSQQQQLRTAQMQLQQSFLAAQNKAMSTFIQKVIGVVKSIAAKKKLALAMPNTSVLYAKDSVDITSDVISALKGK